MGTQRCMVTRGVNALEPQKTLHRDDRAGFHLSLHSLMIIRCRFLLEHQKGLPRRPRSLGLCPVLSELGLSTYRPRLP